MGGMDIETLGVRRVWDIRENKGMGTLLVWEPNVKLDNQTLEWVLIPFHTHSKNQPNTPYVSLIGPI